jgi:hypothetical protein
MDWEPYGPIFLLLYVSRDHVLRSCVYLANNKVVEIITRSTKEYVVRENSIQDIGSDTMLDDLP